jgi:hypothetical protein
MTAGPLESLRSGRAALLVYPLLALLSFPTLGQLLGGEHGQAYAHDVFDLPRVGVLNDWIAHGPTLWNTHLTAGNALLAQGNGPYAIDVALGFVVGPFGAYAITAWLLAVVAGVSMHLFLRDSLGLSTVATVGGAVIYLFGFWHVIYNLAGPAVPLLLWLIDGMVRAGPHRWRYVLAGTLVGGIALYQGLAQLFLLPALRELSSTVVGAADLGDVARGCGFWLASWLLALGLFAPALVTQLVMLPISQRAAWVLSDLYDPTPLVVIRDTLRLYTSALVGVPIGGGWGVSPSVYGTFFLGISGLPLVVLGAIARRHDRRTALVLILLFAIPAADLISVLATPLQDQFGFLKSFQLVRVRHLFPFALVTLAALGLDTLVRSLADRRSFVMPAAGRWRWAVLGATALPLAITLGMALTQVIARRRQVLDQTSPALGWAYTSVALAIGLGLVGLVAIAWWRRGRRETTAVPGMLLALALIGLVGERVTYAHGERFIDGRLGTWADRLGETAGQAFLSARPTITTDRILTFGDDANRMGARDLLQADGYQAIYPETYHAYFAALTRPYLDTNPAMATYVRSWGNRAYAFGPLIEPGLAELAGVRWLYVVGDEVPSVPGIIERFHDGDVHVYEVPGVLPRAFVTDSIAVRPDRAAVLTTLAAATPEELASTAVIESGAGANRLRADLASAGPSAPPSALPQSATITTYAPDRVAIDVRVGRPGVLILTDVMAPGWIAERNGASASIETVDGTFRGVAVDRTTTRVVFRYVPTFTYAGFGIAALASLLGIGWAVVVRRQDHRSIRAGREAGNPSEGERP